LLFGIEDRVSFEQHNLEGTWATALVVGKTTEEDGMPAPPGPLIDCPFVVVQQAASGAIGESHVLS
jgi:hypothetical protein